MKEFGVFRCTPIAAASDYYQAWPHDLSASRCRCPPEATAFECVLLLRQKKGLQACQWRPVQGF
jgi:hypothetical protein